MLVARTAAQVARDRFPDLLFCGVRILFQPGHQRGQETRRAETALQGMGFPEGFLQGMHFLHCAQAFHGDQLPAVDLGRVLAFHHPDAPEVAQREAERLVELLG